MSTKLSSGRKSRALFGLLLVLACICPLVIDLTTKGPVTWHESAVLITAQETLLRERAGERGEWLIPSWYGQPRTAKPPLIPWLTMAAWTNVDLAAASSGELLARSRLVGVILGLVTLGSIFWMGCTLGNRRLGITAALIAASLPMFQVHARMATYDIGLLAGSALAVAGAIWAIRPFREQPQRWHWLIGWLVAALGTGAAWMSKGPLAVAIVACGIGPMIAFDRDRRLRNLLAMAVVILLAALMVWPWYRYLNQSVLDLDAVLKQEYTGPMCDPRPPWYYATRIRWCLPWVFWLGLALAYPFACIRSRRRRRLLGMWAWFACIFVFFSAAPPKFQRYLLPIVPALAILIAAMVTQEQRKADRGVLRSTDWLLVGPHWVALLIFSIAQPVFLAAQPWLVESGWMKRQVYATLPWPAALSIAALLLWLVVIGIRFQRCKRPTAAAIVCALWSCAAASSYWHVKYTAPDDFDTVTMEAQRVLAVVGESPLLYLIEGAERFPSGHFVFATRRVIDDVSIENLRRMTPSSETSYVMADNVPENRTRLEGAGLIHILDFQDGHHSDRSLWRVGPTGRSSRDR